MRMQDFAVSYHSATEIVGLFRQVLEGCKLTSDETLLLFTDTQFYPPYPAAFMAAGQEIGAEVIQMTVPSTLPVISSDYIRDAWKAADLVIGMSQVQWLYSRAHDEARKSGTRALMVIEPIDVLRRLAPDQSVRKRGRAGVPVLTAGKEMRITSRNGTDFVVNKEGREAYTLYGLADEPGKWDHWPQGLVTFFAAPGQGDGTIVVDPGTVFLKFRRHSTEPVELTVREGRIVKFDGGTEARLVEEWFAQWNDPRAYELAHVGWGTEHRADWNVIGMDSEAYYANFLIAFGRNIFWPVGGDNDVEAHWDFCCLDHDIYVDDQVIVENGAIVPENLK